MASPRQSVNQDEERRTENSLKIWILEAKGIPNKKKYFCKLLLDSVEHDRTVSKVKSNMCFWGEYFEYNCRRQVSTICVELMRESDKKLKRVGEVEIGIKTVTSRALVERWYDVKTDKPDKEIPALRIKCRFESVDVLPLAQYTPLRKYLRDHSQSLCQLVEPVVSVKTKEDIATNLVHIMQAEGRAISFLVSLILMDVQRVGENEHLLFRGNSVATKAIDAYMRLVGEHYLRDTLSEPINDLITNVLDCEVDPKRISYPALHKQQETLRACVANIWEKILKSNHNFPVELRQVFYTLRERLSRQEKCELTNNLISSCIFLRFLCPAILSPSLFNITREYPDERAGRSLTLVAKTVQTLANFTHFQGKEDFMEFLNDFIDKEQDRCRNFLQTISSSPSESDLSIEFDGGIDLGKNLALLHLHLVEVMAKVNTQGCNSEASRIQELVDDICFQLGDRKVPPTNRQMSTPVRLNNNYPNIEDSTDSGSSPCVGGNLGIVAGCPVLHHTPTLSGAGSQRSLSLPRSMAIAPLSQQAAASPQTATRRAATDLSTNDDYVLYSALDAHAEPQNFMYPAREANNNTTIGPNVGNEHRLSNGNQYYMPGADVIHTGSVHGSPVTPHAGHVRAYPQQHILTHHYNRHYGRTHSNNRDEYSELYNYMDSCLSNVHATCMDMENNIQGSQTSISQLSNVASSGYQSFVYSQSSSPVDSLLHTDNNSSLLSRENGNVSLLQRTGPHHGSPLHGSPLHHSLLNKHRGVAVHHGYMGQAGHVSLHGTPRHAARVQPPKESPSSSISSSHSVEDLSSARRSRPRHRRSGSTSSDSSPDRQGPQNRVARLPRTNPHCSPRLVTPHHLRSDGHKARTRPDRSSSGRRHGRNMRASADRDEFRPPGLQCSYDDSEEDVAVGNRNPVQTSGHGRTNWVHDDPSRRRVSQEDWRVPPDNISSQTFLNQQEDQMKSIYDRLMTMELEMMQEQEVMRRKMTEKDSLIAAQEMKIAALDSTNTKLRNHIASLTSRHVRTAQAGGQTGGPDGDGH